MLFYACFLGKNLSGGKTIGGKGRLTIARTHTMQSSYWLVFLKVAVLACRKKPMQSSNITQVPLNT